VENKGKLILTEIFPSVQNMIFKSIDNIQYFDVAVYAFCVVLEVNFQNIYLLLRFITLTRILML